MQNENNNFDSTFQNLVENFNELTNKVYTRQNPPTSGEVKEVHFKKESRIGLFI